jgi:hypothetical protein
VEEKRTIQGASVQLVEGLLSGFTFNGTSFGKLADN